MNSATQTRKPPTIGHRFADLKSSSYDATARTIEAVLSVGAPVQRAYGSEVLSINAGAVNLERLTTCGIPLIDSHNICSIGSVLGKLDRVWFDAGKLMGLLSFDDSEAGRMAEGFVTRGTIRGISIGYRVLQWQVTNSDGDVVDPDRLRWDDSDCTFAATRWELLECSLVSVPADASAHVRSFGSSSPIGTAAASEIVERMLARQLAALQNANEPEPTRCARRRYRGGVVWRA
jgi:Caudovirus prohead serine protease